MAAILAARRALAAGATTARAISVRPFSAAGQRWFNSNSQLRRFDDDDEDVVVGNRRGDIDSEAAANTRRFFDVFDPFATPRSLSQVMNLMDNILDASPFVGSLASTGTARRGWDAREDEDALRLRVDMPGLGKDHVKVTAEQNTLVIKGEGDDEWDAGDGKAADGSGKAPRRRYSSRIDLPPDAFRLDQIKAEMRNGVLKITVPKVKHEERKDVFNVSVE